MLTVYQYKKCSTCRDALKWLDAKGIKYRAKEIRETPPSRAELKAALKAAGGNMRKLFNTSGMDYREMGLKERLDAMSDGDAFVLFVSFGILVKRPFVFGDGVSLLGFKEDEWTKTLGC